MIQGGRSTPPLTRLSTSRWLARALHQVRRSSECNARARQYTTPLRHLCLDEHGDSGSLKALGASMIMELGVLLPVFLVPPKVVINLSLGGMGLMLIVGGILIAIPAVSMITELRLVPTFQVEVDIWLLHLLAYLVCLVHGFT